MGLRFSDIQYSKRKLYFPIIVTPIETSQGEDINIVKIKAKKLKFMKK